MRRSILTLLLFAGLAAAQDEHRLASLVPPDTMLLAEFDDLGGYERWTRETALGRMWVEPEMQQFVGGLHKAIAAAVENLRRQGMDPFAIAGLEPTDFTGIAVRRAGLAVIDVDLENNGRPDLVLTIQCRKGIKNVRKILQAVRTAAGTFAGIGFKVEKHGDIEVSWAEIHQAGEIVMAFIGDRFVLTTSRARMHDVLTRLKGGRVQALANAPQFVETLRRMGASKTAALVYVDVQRIAKRVGPVVKALVGDDWDKEAAPMLSLLGLDAIERVALADVPQGVNWRTEFFVKLSERRGLFSLIQDAPTSHRFAAYTPENAFYYVAERGDMVRYFDDLMKWGAKIDPRATQEAREMIARYNKVLGIDLRNDFMQSFGDEWAGYVSVPEGGGMIPDMVVFASVKDRARLEKSLRALVEKYTAVLGMYGERKVKRAPKIRHRKSMAGSHAIHSIEITDRRGEPIPIMPSWTVGEDYVMFALWPQTLRNALARTRSLRDNAEFNRLRRSVPQGSIASSYVDCPKLVGFAYNTLVPVLQGLQGAINRELAPYGASINLHELPPSSVITKHLSPYMSYVKMEKDAMRIGYVSPFGLSLTAMSAGGMGALVGAAYMAGRQRVQVVMVEAEEAQAEELGAHAMRRHYEERLRKLERQIAELRKLIEEK